MENSQIEQKKGHGKIKCVFIVILMLAALLAGVLFFLYTLIPPKSANDNPAWGVTYSPRFARELGLDWQKTYLDILDNLNFKNIRLAAYWDEIEPDIDDYDFNDLDWMIDEASKRNVDVILVFGKKVLRWPECYEPRWTNTISNDEKTVQLLEMVDLIVNRYKDNEHIIMWQVENEVFFPFGTCQKPQPNVFEKEIALVKSLDDRPIMLTDSGELSTWRKICSRADVLGITMYRDVATPMTGDFHWPLPPEWYSKRAWLAEKKVDKVIVAEMQMEPWFNVPFNSVSVSEQRNKFDVELFNDNIDFAMKAGFESYYLWGVEWWYYMNEYGYSEYLEAAKKLTPLN
ncbi:MAG TPA: cellulase family glycosylhydrolase [Candidatus Bipolaricaulota bacterium]|nr:cellulase family glycosylhydrolase [Candidatus Bipolaricaulota bacterium]